MSETTVETREQIEKRVQNAVRRNMKGAVPADGYYAFAVTGETLLGKDKLSQGDKDGNGEGCRQMAVRVAPLEDPTDAGTARNEFEATIWVTLAVPNPDIKGHTVSLKAQQAMANEFVSLTEGRVPYVNKKNEDGTWDNSPEKQAETVAQLTEAAVVANEILAKQTRLTGNIFYASTKAKTSEKGGYFINSRSSQPLQEVEVPESKEGDEEVPF